MSFRFPDAASCCRNIGIKMRLRNWVLLALVFLVCLGMMNGAAIHAATYNESVSGDISGNTASPSTLLLTVGSNSIIGTVGAGAGDFQDFIAVTVPAGAFMTSYVNAAYSSTDAQGFTGFEFGSTFTGNPGAANGYAGYAHFGSGATNPGVNGGNPLTTVGVNLLPVPYMAQNTSTGTAAGATGFTPPLGPGTYTFLIQQSGATASYQFDMTVVPEPTSLCLIGLGGLLLLARCATRRASVS